MKLVVMFYFIMRDLNSPYLKDYIHQRERETEFRNRRRKREEYVADCGYALKRLAMRAFPSISFDSRNIRLIILVVGIH